MSTENDARATGALVTERQRCICPDGMCLDHCRACNYSGRDLEETCIADPAWEPDDEYLAIREARVIPPASPASGSSDGGVPTYPTPPASTGAES